MKNFFRRAASEVVDVCCMALVALLVLTFPCMAQVTAPIPYKNTALSNSAAVVKGSAGVFQWVNCNNPNAAVVFVQAFDSAGTVTVGTTAPTITLGLPASTTVTLLVPAQFFNGIQIAATTTATGGVAPGSALVCNVGFN